MSGKEIINDISHVIFLTAFSHVVSISDVEQWLKIASLAVATLYTIYKFRNEIINRKQLKTKKENE